MRRSSSPSSPSARGFTLIELLLALAIAAVVVTTVNMVFFNVHKHIAAVEERREVYQTARIVLDRMVKDLTCAYVPWGRGGLSGDTISLWRFKGVHDAASGRDVDSVTFTSAADIGFSRYPGCIREVAYYLEEDEKNKGAYILMRREDPTPHRGESTSGSALEVARNVGALEIVYIDEYGQETEQWDLAERLTLPHRVRITLTLGTGEESVTFTATASLPLSGITLESPQG